MSDKTKTYLRFMLMVGLVFGVFYALGIGLVYYLMPTGNEASTDQPTQIETGKRTNILFLGVDARSGDQDSRSDTMILASIDPDKKRVAIVSIPRDTQVKVSGSTLDKINAANVVGGSQLAVKAVESLMGEKVDYYVKMDFEGFKKIVDILGGVTINVDQRMYKPSEDINLQPGEQLLDGKNALAFVRFRGYINGDIDRASHQQAFIKALGKELLQPSTITKLPQLIREANIYMDTNLRITDMLKLATWAPSFSAESIVAQTLPGYFYDVRDDQGALTASYWIADKQQAQLLLEKMLNGQTVAVLVNAPGSTSSTVVHTSDASPQGQANTSTNKQGQLSEKDKTNQERSNLPSAGHGVTIKEKNV